MKVKRLLSAIVAFAMVLTTIASLGTVAFADNAENIQIDVSITPLTAEELEPYTSLGVEIPVNGGAFWFTGVLSNYGTLNSQMTNAGRKIQGFEVNMVFPDEASLLNAIDTSVWSQYLWQQNTGAVSAAVLSVPGGAGNGDNRFGAGFTAQNGGESYPVTKDTVTETDAVTLFKIPFVTKTPYFEADITASVTISTFAAPLGTLTGTEAYKTTPVLENDSSLNTLPTHITVGEAPEKKAKAKYDFEKIESIAKGIYNADNGWKVISYGTNADTGYGYDDTIWWSSAGWGSVSPWEHAPALSPSKNIVRAETATAEGYEAIPVPDMPYQGLQGDSGFENVTIYAGTQYYLGKNLYGDNGDYGKNMVIYPYEGSEGYSNINLYTAPVTENRVVYGFKFKPLNPNDSPLNDTEDAGGFGEIVDSSINGQQYGSSHSMYDKIVRARLDNVYGYAVYNETTSSWTTIATWDEVYNKWHEIKYTLDLDTKEYTVHLDGVEEGTFPFSNTTGQYIEVATGETDEEGNLVTDEEGNPLTETKYMPPITAIDGIQFNVMSNRYSTSMYSIDDVYATEAPVTITFINDETGDVITTIDAQVGDNVPAPELLGLTVVPLESTVNVQDDMTVRCTVTINKVGYIEDFEDFSINYDLVDSRIEEIPAGQTNWGWLLEELDSAPNFTYTDNMIETSGGLDVSFYDKESGTYRLNDKTKVVEEADGNHYLYVYDTPLSGALRLKFKNGATATTGLVKASFSVSIDNDWSKMMGEQWAQTTFGALGNSAGSGHNARDDMNAVRMLACYALAGYMPMNGPTWSWQQVATYGPGWHDFTYYADIEAQKYYVVCDGKMFGPYGFNKDCTTIDELFFENFAEGGALQARQYKLDDVEILPLASPEIVTLHGYNGEVIGTTQARPLTDENPPTASAPEGQRFIGWYKDAEFTQPVTYFTLLGDEGVTDIYARFDKNVLTEDFEDASIDYTNHTFDSDFDVTLGANHVGGYELNSDVVKVESNGPTGNYLAVNQDRTSSGLALYSFPNVTEGKIKASFDINIQEFPEYFDSIYYGLVDVTNNSTDKQNIKKVATLISGYSNLSDKDTNFTYVYPGTDLNSIADDVEYPMTLAEDAGWTHVEMVVDLDRNTVKFNVGGEAYGTYAIAADVTKVNGLYFSSNGTDMQGGKYYVDNIEVNAAYKEDVVMHAVTFKNWDGSILMEVDVEEGETATYNGPTPTRDDDDEFFYEFEGWDVDLTNITSDIIATATYTAVRKPTIYTVTFNNWDDTALAAVQVEEGKTAVYTGPTPTKASDDENIYLFDKWVNEDGTDADLTNISSSFTVKASYTAVSKDEVIPFSAAYDFEDMATVAKGKYEGVAWGATDWSTPGITGGSYYGLQDDSGFDDVAVYASGGYGLYQDSSDYGTNMTFMSADWSAHYDNVNFYTMPVTKDKVSYGFKFKTWTAGMATEGSDKIGGFGEIVDSSINGRNYGGTHYMDDKIVRARLDKAYGYAVYNETTAEWTTIATWDELGEHPNSTWNEVEYTLDLATKTYTVYFNGVEKGTFPFSNQGTVTAIDGIQFNTLQMGDSYGSSAYWIDDVWASNTEDGQGGEGGGEDTVTFVCGDVNGDGVADGMDASLIMLSTTGGSTAAGGDYEIGAEIKGGNICGDVNGDGVADGMDASLIMLSTTGGSTAAGGEYEIGEEVTL